MWTPAIASLSCAQRAAQCLSVVPPVLLHCSGSRCNVQLRRRRGQRQPCIHVVHLHSTAQTNHPGLQYELPTAIILEAGCTGVMPVISAQALAYIICSNEALMVMHARDDR